MMIYELIHFKAILKWQIKYVFHFVVSICCLQKNIVFNYIFQKWFIFFLPIIIKRRNTSMELAKIKSHFRHRSQQDSIRLNTKNIKSSNIQEIAQKINIQPLNLKSTNETESKLNKLSKRFQFQQIKSLRNSIDYNRIDKMSWNQTQNQNFQKQLKNFQQSIQDFQITLSAISKRNLKQQNKNNLLSRIIQMIKIQIQSKPPSSITLVKNQSIKDDKQLISKEKQQIQKIANSHNTNLSINKALIEQIQNQRKFRILYETYFYTLQKEIRKHQIIYYTFLIKSLQNKFLYFVISDNDIVSNGHVLGFKKQSSEENEKDMMRNTYMCLPTKKQLDQDEDKNSYKRKSSKCIDKKGKIKKLVKILNFVQTSKALQSSQLSLYEQQQLLDNSRGRIFSSFRTQHEMFNFPTNKKDSQKKKIFGNSSKYRQRSAKIISIKFISHMNTYYESEFDEIVYELFRLYQQLGINIFTQPSTQDSKQNKFEDFFNFDEQRLIQESQRRIQLVRMSLEKMTRFNSALDQKIFHLNQNIIQTEQFKDQLQKRKKKQQQNNYCEVQQQKQTIQTNLYEKSYLDVLQLLKINPMDFNSDKQIEFKIQKLIQIQKQQKQSKKQNPIETINDDGISSIEKNQNIENSSKFIDSSKLMNSKQSLLHTINSFVEPSKTKYAKGMLKTQGFQRKFHKLIKHQQEDNMSKTSKLNQTSRSIFQNGMKSLDNIFGNMKTCESYKRAFMREQFQKQYTKEITKKKRVMFRRQAKVLPSFID